MARYHPAWGDGYANGRPVARYHALDQRGLGAAKASSNWMSQLYDFLFSREVRTAVGLALLYHGYKRNGNSVPWGAAWALGGVVCPSVTMGFALTQGFATRTKGD